MRGRRAFLTMAVLASVCPHALPAMAALSQDEGRLAQRVDSRVTASTQLLERIVDINSGTMNFDGVRAVSRLVAPEFERLGFETRWIAGAGWNRAGHLVAERRGRQGATRVLLIGHLDTVFESDSPFQRYERIDERYARGPGVIDDKGGIVVMLTALGALADAKALDGLTVTVMLSGDEEKRGFPPEPARRDLVTMADEADIAIGFEDGDGDPATAVVARRSASDWKLWTAGHPSHSSQIFRDDVGSGAIYEAARILTAFRDSLGGDPNLTFNPGVIAGGTTASIDGGGRAVAFGKTNVVAESTFVEGDLRVLTPQQRAMAEAAMRRIVERHLPLTSAGITFDHKYPPLTPSDGNRELLALFDRVSRDLGFGEVRPVDPSRAGAADISFADGYVDAAIDGVGLMGSGGHTAHETADLTTLAIQAKRVAVLLQRIAGGEFKP